MQNTSPSPVNRNFDRSAGTATQKLNTPKKIKTVKSPQKLRLQYQTARSINTAVAISELLN